MRELLQQALCEVECYLRHRKMEQPNKLAEELRAALAQPAKPATRHIHENAAQLLIEYFICAELGLKNSPGFTTEKQGESGSESHSWAFWILEEDTASFLHEDGRIEWSGTGWEAKTVAQPAQTATREAFEAWQPIETAPKDGTPILVANNVRGGSWIACYCPVNSHGCKLVNPWHCMMLNTRWHNTPHATTAPTVWQPLPLPPVAADSIRARSNDE